MYSIFNAFLVAALVLAVHTGWKEIPSFSNFSVNDGGQNPGGGTVTQRGHLVIKRLWTGGTTTVTNNPFNVPMEI